MKNLDKINQRLDVWAKWALTYYAAGLGYPAQSVEARLICYGQYYKASSTGEVTVPVNFVAEEMDRYVRELALFEPILAQALRIFYLSSGTNDDKAALLGCSYVKFKNHVNYSRCWLAGRTQIK